MHIRLAAVVDEETGVLEADSSGHEGGVQQQRHPGLPEEGIFKSAAFDDEPDLGLSDDETDLAADKRVMDRLRGLGSAARAHAINEGVDHTPGHGPDLMTDF